MKQPRPYKAGAKLGNAICETSNILYLLDNKVQYLQGLIKPLQLELEKTLGEINAKKNKER